MRRKSEVEQRQCDQCLKTVEQSEQMFGGNKFGGWLRVERTDDGYVIPRGTVAWDFCSLKCALEYLTVHRDQMGG